MSLEQMNANQRATIDELHAEVERLRKLLKELRNATCDLCACVGVAPAGVLRDANKAMDAALEAITIPEGG